MVSFREIYSTVLAFVEEKNYTFDEIKYDRNYYDEVDKCKYSKYEISGIEVDADTMYVRLSSTDKMDVWLQNSFSSPVTQLHNTHINNINEFLKFLKDYLSRRKGHLHPMDNQIPNLYQTLNRIIDIVDKLHNK